MTDAPAPPFLVLALPRSRTAWLTRFLSYGPFHCEHEQARHIRSIGDARAWLAQDFTGAAETGIARWWRLIRVLRPDVRIAVVRRPVGEVVDSLMRLDLAGVGAFGRARLTHEMHRLDRALDQIERRVPGVLSVSFASLGEEAACRRVFEHCLGLPHDPEWWASLAPVNVQCDMRALMRYTVAHGRQMAAAARACQRQMRALLGAKPSLPLPATADGVVIQQERLDTFWRDAQPLFREHCIEVGEPPDQYLRKNMLLIQRIEDAGSWHFLTARCNGRMLGYLASIVAPSIEHEGVLTATQTLLYASKDAAGMNLAMRLQRASIQQLYDRDVSEIYMRAGVRGSGPKLGTLYRRLGAEDFGQLYKLDLDSAQLRAAA